MLRVERRALRNRLYHLKRDAAIEAKRVDYKTSGETGAITPPVKHPGRRRWGGKDGRNLNGAAHKYDRARITYVTGYYVDVEVKAGNGAVREIEEQFVKFVQPIPDWQWKRILDDGD